MKHLQQQTKHLQGQRRKKKQKKKKNKKKKKTKKIMVEGKNDIVWSFSNFKWCSIEDSLECVSRYHCTIN